MAQIFEFPGSNAAVAVPEGERTRDRVEQWQRATREMNPASETNPFPHAVHDAGNRLHIVSRAVTSPIHQIAIAELLEGANRAIGQQLGIDRTPVTLCRVPFNLEIALVE